MMFHSSITKLTARVLGIAFLLFGIAGFFVRRELFGFEVSTIRNVVCILSGVILLAVAAKFTLARYALIILGLVYGVFAILGFANGDVAGLFYVGGADNVLHLLIALLCLGVGFGGKK